MKFFIWYVQPHVQHDALKDVRIFLILAWAELNAMLHD